MRAIPYKVGTEVTAMAVGGTAGRESSEGNPHGSYACAGPVEPEEGYASVPAAAHQLPLLCDL